MADEEKKRVNPILPTVTLPADQIKGLEDLGEDLDRAEKELEQLEKLGLGVQALRDRLAWVREARETLLTFKPEGEKEE